jgi:hypothetical protein
MTFGGLAADGQTFGLAVHLTDPVGRLAVLAQAGGASAGAWQGARAAMAWRGTRPAVLAQAWWADQRPARQRSLGGAALDTLGVSYRGGMVGLSFSETSTHGSSTAVLAGSGGHLVYDAPALSGFVRGARVFGVLDVSSRYQWTPGGVVRILADQRVNIAVGSTHGVRWNRDLTELGLGVAPYDGFGLGVRGRVGSISAGAPAFEQFVFGGSPSPYVDDALLGQRVTSPGVPFALRSGSRLASLAVESSGGPFRAYYEWVAAGTVLEQFNRLVGVDITATVPPVTMLRLPAMAVRLGVTQSLDTPWRRKTLGYTVLTITP